MTNRKISNHSPFFVDLNLESELEHLDVEKLVETWNEHFRRGFLRIAVLSSFNHTYMEDPESTLTGAELRELIRTISPDNWDPSPGSIYPLLAKLVADEVIIEVNDQNKKTKAYQITDKGRKLLYILGKKRFFLGGRNLQSLVNLKKEDLEKFRKYFYHHHMGSSIEQLNLIKNAMDEIIDLINSMIQEKVKDLEK
ncbi:MAG: PadR family transcriptional regulator [Promethearchaeota archaeon]